MTCVDNFLDGLKAKRKKQVDHAHWMRLRRSGENDLFRLISAPWMTCHIVNCVLVAHRFVCVILMRLLVLYTLFFGICKRRTPSSPLRGFAACFEQSELLVCHTSSVESVLSDASSFVVLHVNTDSCD